MNEKQKARVDALIVEHLGCDPEKVSPAAQLEDDLGADSLDKVELAMAFEEAFGGDIPDDVVEKLVTVEDCYAAIDANIVAARA